MSQLTEALTKVLNDRTAPWDQDPPPWGIFAWKDWTKFESGSIIVGTLPAGVSEDELQQLAREALRQFDLPSGQSEGMQQHEHEYPTIVFVWHHASFAFVGSPAFAGGRTGPFLARVLVEVGEFSRDDPHIRSWNLASRPKQLAKVS